MMTFREFCQSLAIMIGIGLFATALVAVGDHTGNGSWYWAALFPGTVTVLYAGGIVADLLIGEYRRRQRIRG